MVCAAYVLINVVRGLISGSMTRSLDGTSTLAATGLVSTIRLGADRAGGESARSGSRRGDATARHGMLLSTASGGAASGGPTVKASADMTRWAHARGSADRDCSTEYVLDPWCPGLCFVVRQLRLVWVTSYIVDGRRSRDATVVDVNGQKPHRTGRATAFVNDCAVSYCMVNDDGVRADRLELVNGSVVTSTSRWAGRAAWADCSESRSAARVLLTRSQPIEGGCALRRRGQILERPKSLIEPASAGLATITFQQARCHRRHAIGCTAAAWRARCRDSAQRLRPQLQRLYWLATASPITESRRSSA